MSAPLDRRVMQAATRAGLGWLAAASLSAVALATLALALQPLPAAAQGAPAAAAMARPDFQPGDRWVYRESDLLTRQDTGTLGEAVRAVDADGIWLGRRSGAGASWARVDPATSVMREVFAAAGAQATQRGRLLASNDGGCAYPWPLKPGQTFDCVEMTTWPNGWRVRYDLSFKVEGWETIEVPAGRFETLKLVAQGNYLNETSGLRGGQERLLWLAPAIKREVRAEIRSLTSNNKPNRVEGRELVEFTRAAN